jgi:hypothetical protein
MESYVGAVIQVLLAGCAIVIAAGPRPAALVAWIVSSHLDPVALAGPDPGAMVGILNAVRILGFPAILWMRLGIAAGIPSGRAAWLAWAWAAIVVYVTASLAWTPVDMRFAGMKQVGYLAAYGLGAAAAIAAYRRRIITEPVIGTAIYLVLGLAVVQTYLLGNPFGDTLYEDRFVSFGSKQQFGEALVALLVLALFVVRFRPVTQGWYVVLLVVAELLNGSRVGLAGMAFVLVIWMLQARTSERVAWSVTVLLVATTVIGLVAVGGVRVAALEGLRIHEVWRALGGTKGLEGVGTWKARVEFWDAVRKRMAEGTAADWAFGRGVSSGGRLGLRQGSEPNRTFHNEYLRVLYEFGLVGSVLLTLFLTGIVVAAVWLAVGWGSYALLSFLPALLGFLGVENVFSGAGAAGGLGIVLILGSAAVAGLGSATPIRALRRRPANADGSGN